MSEHNPVDKHFPPYVCDANTMQPTFVGPNKSMENFFRVQMHLAGDPVIRSIVRSDEESSLQPHPYHITTETEFGEEDAKRIQGHVNQAQTLFRLYKKKECERKRRYKNKGLTPSDTKEFYLNRCGICDRLRPAVNIFWGTVMCEKCYFTPSRIQFVMNRIFLEVEPMEPREKERHVVEEAYPDSLGEIPKLYADIPFSDPPDFCRPYDSTFYSRPPSPVSTPPLIIPPSTPILNEPASPTEDEILQGLLWGDEELNDLNLNLSPEYCMGQ